MLGHLKAADFVNLMEGGELPAKYQAHLEACVRCRTTWESMRSVQAELSSLESEIPEPDWAQFRSSVRDKLLSRSIQRETAVRRWTGWSLRPAAAWALSLVMAIGITTLAVLWKIDSRKVEPIALREPVAAAEPVAEVLGPGPEKSLFDDLAALGEEEEEMLQQMLESEQ
jgi:hypothetical protein